MGTYIAVDVVRWAYLRMVLLKGNTTNDSPVVTDTEPRMSRPISLHLKRAHMTRW